MQWKTNQHSVTQSAAPTNASCYSIADQCPSCADDSDTTPLYCPLALRIIKKDDAEVVSCNECLLPMLKLSLSSLENSFLNESSFEGNTADLASQGSWNVYGPFLKQ